MFAAPRPLRRLEAQYPTVHRPFIWTVSTRRIVGLFSMTRYSGAQYAAMRDQFSTILAAPGQRFVELAVETGPPKHALSQHSCLLRIARGEVDGVALLAMPARMKP